MDSKLVRGCREDGIGEAMNRGGRLGVAEFNDVRTYTAKLVKLSDSDWARYLYHSKFHLTKSLKRTSGTEAITRLHQVTQEAAATHWAGLTRRGEGQNYVFPHPATEIKRYGVSVEPEVPGPLDSSFIHFGLYDPSRKCVEFSEKALGNVESYIEAAELTQLLGSVCLRDVVLWHEYYHVSVRHGAKERHGVKNWIDHVLHRRQEMISPIIIEELSAILFSKLACGVPYNPQLFQWLLVYTVSPERALDMAEDILEMSVMK